MSGTLSPTAAYVDVTGIHAPTFAEVQDYLIGQFQAIYGTDIVVDPSTQDGQLIGVFALAIADTNAACIATYNAFSPSTAQGVGLSSMVKLNGLLRHVPSNSTTLLQITGTAGTVISNGQAQDTPGNLWNLPTSVTIPPGGQIFVTGTCATLGAVNAAVGDVNRIKTVTLGWQTVTNTTEATPGAPLESDGLLRIRQASSTALPALTVLSGVIGAVAALDGVTAVKGYENDTGTTDPATTIPPHSISLVVQGGDAVEICQTILLKKTPGCYTFGTTRESVEDMYGLAHDIGFFIPTPIQIGVSISLKALPGYTTLIGQTISQTVADYINGLGSGGDVVYSKLWLPANLCDALGAPTGATNTYDILHMAISVLPGGTYGSTNIPINIYEIATCKVTDVVIAVS